MNLKPKVAEDPYIWPRQDGVLPAWMLRHYGSWLMPQLQRRWLNDEERDPIYDPMYPLDPEVNPTHTPYVWQRAAGICRVKDLRHFGEYALDALVPQREPILAYDVGTDYELIFSGYLQPMTEPEPYIWVRSRGLAMVRDLRRFNDHVDYLLRTRREPKPDINYIVT